MGPRRNAPPALAAAGRRRAIVALAQRRCLHHPSREAAARCPSCARFFCRECVTEHDGRLACADCLAAAAVAAPRPTANWKSVLRPLGALAGLLLAWMIFYYAGQLLTRLPSRTHATQEPGA